MKAIVAVTLIVSLAQVAFTQECRQIISTVCDEDALPPRRGGGEKGDVGAPGKAGSPGSKGSKGEVGGIGPKGVQGESCALGSFGEDLMREIEDLRNRVSPMSCVTSPIYGRQTLRSGREAFCEGGWTVFHKRFNGNLNFAHQWNDYKNGFGNLSGEFWLGLDEIHNLTLTGQCSLRVDVWTSTGRRLFATYSNFSVEDESDNYRLHVSGYSGTAGDGLTEHSNVNLIHNNMQFSTLDRDNDLHSRSNCAVPSEGGWWFNRCWDSNLHRSWGNLVWDVMTVQSSTMKLRCD